MPPKKIKIISTGGTISTQPDPSKGRLTASLLGQDLVKKVPGLQSIAEIQVEQFCNVLSFALTLEDMFRLAQTVNKSLAEEEIDGIVVTHGTATMEESAYMMDLLLKSEKPVVYTGAMYSASDPDSDGPRNILYSCHVAANDDAWGKGALVCFNGEVHAARDVAKTHTFSVQTFHSFEHGILGSVDEEKVVFYRAPLLRYTVETPQAVQEVDLIKVVAGMDDRLLKAAADSGVKGIVVEGLPGYGAVPPRVLWGMRDVINRGIPIVYTSRSPIGRVAPIKYGGGGGALDISDTGAIFAGDLRPVKARILLSLVLGATTDFKEIEAIVKQVAP